MKARVVTLMLCAFLPAAALAAAHPSPVADRQGDTSDFFAGPDMQDIQSVDITYDASALYFTISFYNEIGQPSASNSLPKVFGEIGLDLDQDPATGYMPEQSWAMYDGHFPPVSAGLEMTLDFDTEWYSGYANTFAVSGLYGLNRLPVTYASHSISGTVPLTYLGNDDGQVNFVAIVGGAPHPSGHYRTDTLDYVGYSVPVPEPTALALLAFATLAVRRGR